MTTTNKSATTTKRSAKPLIDIDKDAAEPSDDDTNANPNPSDGWDEAPDVVDFRFAEIGDELVGRYLGSRVVPTRYGPRRVHVMDCNGNDYEFFLGTFGDRKMNRMKLGRMTRIALTGRGKREGSSNEYNLYSIAQRGPQSRDRVIGREKLPMPPASESGDDFGSDDIPF